ncbi:MAG: RNA-binding domain-containing protein [Candidatus Poseidoniales archaeon]
MALKQQIQGCFSIRLDMGFHRVQLRTTVSSMMEIEVVKSAMHWLAGDDIEIQIDKTTSYHGAQIQMLSVELKKNRDIQSFFSRILPLFSENFLEHLEDRIDDSFVFHLRLDADHLIEKAIVIHDDKKNQIIKCEAKIEVYPQQNAIEVFKDFLGSLNTT